MRLPRSPSRFAARGSHSRPRSRRRKECKGWECSRADQSSSDRLRVLFGRRDRRLLAFPLLPARREERQEIAGLVRVLLQLAEYEIAAEARTSRNIDRAILGQGGVPIDDVALPVDVELVEQLLDEQVRRAGID